MLQMIINAIFENFEPRNLKVLPDGEIPDWVEASEIAGVQFGPLVTDRKLDTIIVTPVSVDALLSVPTSMDEETKSLKVQLCKFSLDELGIGNWIISWGTRPGDYDLISGQFEQEKIVTMRCKLEI
ncbi:MAG: hypothetical protein ACTSWA_12760 [Candidatus Thorarchaeota archaeon]